MTEDESWLFVTCFLTFVWEYGMQKIVTVLLGITFVGIVAFFVLRWFAGRAERPSHLGVDGNGRFAPCPSSPNCVSTQAVDEIHSIPPIPFTTDTPTAQAKMVFAIEQMNGSTVVTQESNYIHAEFRTPTMRFVDDVEFYFEEKAGEIHFRSASRLGYGDGNLNRKRMEAVRRRFNQ